MALVYAWIREGIKGKGALSKGLFYGFILFLVAGIPWFLGFYLLINIPIMLNVMWMVEGLIVYLIGGIIIAALIK
jgi:hypothetical protein